jgi:hypothetical protein
VTKNIGIILLLFACLSYGSPADTVAPAVTSKIIPWRMASVASLVSVSYMGSYFLVFKDGWWDSTGNKFNFQDDFEYAKNLDKGGHFFAGVLLAEGFHDGFRWSGASERSSYLLGATMASLTHVGIDIKDGYSAYGYSMFDVLSGTLGGFYPMARHYIPAMQYVDYKFSYWRNSDAYWNQPGEHAFVATDDYCNQTHWLSFKIDKMLPTTAATYWPDFLAVSTGLGVQDKIFLENQLAQAKYEVFVGLDWDLENAFHPKTLQMQRVIHYLNYIKLPAPTLQVYPVRKLQWVYPIAVRF